MIQVSKEMSFIAGMKDKMIHVKQGNVLHSWDEGQMGSSKERKCPS
nr:hypothetical protein [Neobacillus sp. Marseille-Q6967]